MTVKPAFALCCIFSALAWWMGPLPAIGALGLALFVSWGMLKWLGVGIVLLALTTQPSAALDCLDTGDCRLADRPVEPQGLTIGCIGSEAEECRWTTLDYSLQGIATGLQIADFGQTFAATRTSRFVESNALLGAHPSQAKVAAYGIAAITLHLAGSAILPRPWRTIWQSVGIGFEGNTMLAWVSFYQG